MNSHGSSVGVFVSFDGPGGVGKSTLVGAVTTALADRGVTPVATCEPTYTPLGELLRMGTHTYQGMAMACLIAGDRHQHLAAEINPALREGRIVVCDRYLPSSLVLQGMDDVPSDVIWQLHRDIRIPDVAVLLSADVEILQQRLAGRGAHSRYERQPGISRTETDLYREAAGELRRMGWPVMEIDTTHDGCESIATMVADHILHLHQRKAPA